MLHDFFFGRDLVIHFDVRTLAEKEANRKVATRFFEVATHFYGKEIMEYAFPLEHQKSILDKGLPLRMDQVRPALEKAQTVIESVVSYLKELPLPLANLHIVESIGIAQIAQAEADRAAAAYAELGEPARHLVDAIVPTLKAAGFTALLAGEVFLSVQAFLHAFLVAPRALPALGRFIGQSPFVGGLLIYLTVSAIEEIDILRRSQVIMGGQVIEIISSLREINRVFERFAIDQTAKEKALETQLRANTAINRALAMTKTEGSEKAMDRIEEAVRNLPPEERYPNNMDYMRAMQEASFLDTHAERAAELATEAARRPINTNPPKNIFPAPPWKRGAGI